MYTKNLVGNTNQQTMWTTMGYNESINDFNLPNGRKLLVPIQSHTAAPANFLDHINHASPHVPRSSATTNTVAENGKRELNSMSSCGADVVASSRWNPTPEQIERLEDLYRRGTRTPSAQQIQLITAQLQRYGKIEGKNVFYWFQNHKARERQKRRRHQMNEPGNNNNCNNNAAAATDIETFDKFDLPGENRAPVFEIEQDKNWLMSTATCSTTTLPQELLMSLKRAGRRITVDDDYTEYRPMVANDQEQTWVQFDHKQEDEQLQQNINTTNENGRWQMSCPPQSYSSNIAACNQINTSTATNTTTSFFCTNTAPADGNDINSPGGIEKDSTVSTSVQSHASSTTTLQLFPLQTINEEEDHCHQIDCRDDHRNMTYQYFEFLPLKDD